MRVFIFQPTDNTICWIQNVTLQFGELKFNLVKNKLTSGPGIRTNTLKWFLSQMVTNKDARVPLSSHAGIWVTVQITHETNKWAVLFSLIYCRADLFSLVSSDIQDIRYLTPRQQSKISFVPGSSSLGGKEKDAQTFNNQHSENYKEHFYLGITHTEVQRGIKENHREKIKLASQIQSHSVKQESHHDNLQLLRSF